MKRKSEKPRSVLRDYGLTVGVAIFVALGIRFFLLEAYRIPGGSMSPTLEPGDTLFVTKFPFGLRLPGQTEPFTRGREPEIGEVVVYDQPGDPPREAIKRIVARAGDIVQLTQGRLTINGRDLAAGVPADQPCGPEKSPSGASWTVCWEAPPLEDYGPTRVPPGSVFLIGDSRTQTIENRGIPQWATVPVSHIKGKAAWIWLSIQPPMQGNPHPLFSRIRFERIFRRI